MNRHLCYIVFTSVIAIALGAPLDAQVGGQRGGLGASSGPAQGRGVQADDKGPRPQAFSVSLVLGEMQASGAADTVPAAARKALTDVKDFLPYKAYRLLDSQWTLCCGRSPIMTRLRGPEDQDYSLELMPSSAGNGKYYVHFSLWEPRPSETTEARPAATTASTAALEAQYEELRRRLAELRKTESENHPDVVGTRAKIEALERSTVDMRRSESTRRTLAASAPRRAIIDTSFTMDIGETVVVGTSRLKGDKALIALLTAVAPTKSTTK